MISNTAVDCGLVLLQSVSRFSAREEFEHMKGGLLQLDTKMWLLIKLLKFRPFNEENDFVPVAHILISIITGETD